MFLLRLSNSLENLLEQLIEDIKKEQSEKNLDNIYEPINIIIPNKNIEYWLKQKIAEKYNICMNYEFSYFEDTILRLLSIDHSRDINEQKIDPNFLSLVIYQILLEEIENNTNHFQYFRSYLEEHREYYGNIYNLSLKLAELWFQYNFHNPYLVDLLQKEYPDFDIFKDMDQKIFYDERYIYKKMKQKLNEWNITKNQNFQFFFELYKNYLNTNLNNKPIFIFAFQFNNYFYYKLLAELKNIFNIYYYQIILYDYTNFNTNFTTENPAQKISFNNLQLLKITLSIPEENILYINNKNEKTNTLLEQLQNTFFCDGIQKTINFNPVIEIKEEKPTIRFFEAPDKKSEIKAIINDIQISLLEDEELKLNDIAILSPVLKDYYPLLEGYLEYLNIPFNVQDPDIVQHSYFPSGIEMVCSLLEDYKRKTINFDKEEIISIIQNPVFRITHNLNDTDIHIFLKIIKNLKIYYENKNDPYHSWQVGIKRVNFGKILDLKEIISFIDNDGESVEILPYEDFEFDIDLLEKFNKSIIELIEDIKRLHTIFDNQNLPIRKVYEEFEKIIIKHFNVFLYKDTFHIEKKVYNEFKKSLSYLKILDIKPDPHLLKIYFKSMFEQVKGSIYEYLFHGITISSLQPLRPVPFKKIYILGLNQENFPGKEISSSLNLVDYFIEENHKDKNYLELIKNNILKKSEENIFLFYEIFFSTRKQITLSYVCKDLESKKELFPCYLYLELKELVKKILDRNKNINKENYIKEIPLTLHIRTNKIYNSLFEFYLSILATYREELNKILEISQKFKELENIKKNVKIEKEIDNLQKEIGSFQTNSLKEIYKNIKFPEDKICINIIEKNNYKLIDINNFIQFIKSPIESYLKRNEILYKFEKQKDENYYTKNLEANEFLIKKLIKEILMEFVNSSTIKSEITIEENLIENIKKILYKNYIEGNLPIQLFKNELIDENHNLFKKIKNYFFNESKESKKSSGSKDIELSLFIEKIPSSTFFIKNRITFHSDISISKEELATYLENEIKNPHLTLEMPPYEFNNYKIIGDIYIDAFIFYKQRKLGIYILDLYVPKDEMDLYNTFIYEYFNKIIPTEIYTLEKYRNKEEYKFVKIIKSNNNKDQNLWEEVILKNMSSFESININKKINLKNLQNGKIILEDIKFSDVEPMEYAKNKNFTNLCSEEILYLNIKTEN